MFQDLTDRTYGINQMSGFQWYNFMVSWINAMHAEEYKLGRLNTHITDRRDFVYYCGHYL